MFADYHVHSHFSEDTDFPMELEIQKAIKLGMDELCFTEHSDYDVPTVVNCDYDAYFEEMEKMKEERQQERDESDANSYQDAFNSSEKVDEGNGGTI